MPASWLVTRPPRPMSKNVATAFSTANQNNAGWYLLFIIGKERPLWIVSRSGRGREPKFISRPRQNACSGALRAPREHEFTGKHGGHRPPLQQRGRFAEVSFHLEREVLRRAGVFDFDFGGLHAEFAMLGFQRVFARRYVFDGEFPIPAAHGKIRMIKHADPREHPRMHVTLEFQERLWLVESKIQIRAARHL